VKTSRVAVIADSHLSGPGGPAGPLLQQLEALPGQGCDRLVLLGDIFQAWIGSPRFETPDITAVVATLRKLRQGGLRIDYIEGNRDFFLKRSPYADAFDHVGTEVSFEAGGKRYLAVHGDGLNDRDWQYRFWRSLSKSAPVRLAVMQIPRGLAHKMVHSTERRLSQTNFKHKARIPEEAIRSYAERRMTEGYDVLLLGHFHEARKWQIAGKSGQTGGEVRLLEAWFSSRRVEWFGGE